MESLILTGLLFCPDSPRFLLTNTTGNHRWDLVFRRLRLHHPPMSRIRLRICHQLAQLGAPFRSDQPVALGKGTLLLLLGRQSQNQDKCILGLRGSVSLALFEIHIPSW